MDNQQTLNQVQNLTTLINGHILGIDRQREALGKVKEMLDSTLNNDPGYQEADTKAKEAGTDRAKVKARVLQQPNAHDLNFKVKETRIELKQLNEELSKFLAEYQKLTGSNEFEGEDGEIRQIVYTAKLVGKTHLNDQS